MGDLFRNTRAVQPLIEQVPLLKTSDGASLPELSCRKVVKARGETGPDATDAASALELLRNPKERGKSADEPLLRLYFYKSSRH